MGRFKLWMLIGGAALVFLGIQEWRLCAEVKGTPQKLSCAALARDGYGDNAHVELTDFLASSAGFVYEKKRGGDWSKVWVPLVPLDGPYAEMLRALPEGAEIPAPETFGVILQTSNAKNEKALGKLVDKDVLRGVVINEIDSLDRETKKLLAESYPGIDLEKCWIVEEGRSVRSVAMCLLFIVLGLALAGGGIFFFIRGARKG